MKDKVNTLKTVKRVSRKFFMDGIKMFSRVTVDKTVYTRKRKHKSKV